MTEAKSNHGLPPLRNLRRILDARSITRAQLTRRCGLSVPTVGRAIRAEQGVRDSTANEIARALGVPAEVLWRDMEPDELARAARYPAVTAGRSYRYPEVAAHPAEDEAPAADGIVPEAGQPTMANVLARLEAIEEMLLDLATRPIAVFDVEVRVSERNDRRG